MWNIRQQYVKDVLDDPAFDLGNLRTGLETICTNALNEQPLNWRTMLIAKPELFRLCNQGFIVRNNYEVVLLHESQRNHHHSELYSKYLELELKDTSVSYAPFKSCEYVSVRSNEYLAAFFLKGYFFCKQEINLEILYRSNQYWILFYRSDESVSLPDKLQRTLISCGFIMLNELEDYDPKYWDCSDDNYIFHCKELKNILFKISELCINLLNLEKSVK